MKPRKFPLYVKILIGMALGVGAGFLAVHGNWTPQVNDWIKPFGEIFMRLLKFIAIPLVLVSLIRGVANIGDIGTLSKLGVRTIGLYLTTTVAAILLGLTLVQVIAPGRTVSPESASVLQTSYGENIAARSQQVETVGERPPLQMLVDVFPENMVGSLGNNGGMLQVIVIALLLGVAILLVGREKSAPFLNLLEALDAVILKVIDLIMRFAPVGVFALMAGMISDTAGNVELLGALGLYVVTVVLGLALIIWGFYPLLVQLFTRISAGKFIREIFPVQLVAFTTSSSAATLPFNMETVERRLGVSPQTASFVLPTGMTINMDGTSLYQAVAAVFIAQVLGIHLGWAEMVTLVATCTLSSIGTPGIPGGSIVVLLMVLSSIGVPPEGLALILGLDRPLDMLRTVANVTGDATVSLLADRPNQKEPVNSVPVQG